MRLESRLVDIQKTPRSETTLYLLKKDEPLSFKYVGKKVGVIVRMGSNQS